MTTLVRPERPDHQDLDGLSSQIAELESRLTERDGELAREKSDLDRFKIHYRQEVGTLHEQLDALELAIAEAELGELSKRVASAKGTTEPSTGTARPEPLPRYTSDAARKLFRDVAKAIHPDLARDQATQTGGTR